MRNITGSPVEDDDFYDRYSDFVRFVREILNSSNLLLVAPRRVGKTSFVLRLCEVLANPDSDTVLAGQLEEARMLASLKGLSIRTAFFNAEGCHDELDFAERLVATLQLQAHLKAGLFEQAESAFRRFREIIGIRKVNGPAGVDMELADSSDLNGVTLGRMLESILRGIETSEEPQTVVIAVDELPELLLALVKEDKGGLRVERFLHWLRSMRQTYRKRVRWIFLGSIGLDTFVDQRGIRKTINDLTLMTLGAYSPEVADSFLCELSNSLGLPLSKDVRKAIIDKVGWPLPYHLQLLVNALVALKSDQQATNSGGVTGNEVTIEDVNAAVEHLLQPAGFGNFDTWRQRLEEQFDPASHSAAMTLLKFLCQHPAGRTRSDLLNELMKGPNPPDIDEAERRLSSLLVILCRDGYLLEQDGRYAFRSFLLREYWYRREIR